MRTLVQIKTDDFELISQEFDADMDAEAAVRAYMDLRRSFKQAVGGLERQAWNRVLDAYRKDEGISAEIMEHLSDTQKWMLHELDKSDERLKE